MNVAGKMLFNLFLALVTWVILLCALITFSGCATVKNDLPHCDDTAQAVIEKAGAAGFKPVGVDMHMLPEGVAVELQLMNQKTGVVYIHVQIDSATVPKELQNTPLKQVGTCQRYGRTWIEMKMALQLGKKA